MRQAEESWYGATRQAITALEERLQAWHHQSGIPEAYSRIRNAQLLAHHGIPSLTAHLDRWYESVRGV